MSDTPPSNNDGVLKPYAPIDVEPLPPVEPSSVPLPPPPPRAPAPPPVAPSPSPAPPPPTLAPPPSTMSPVTVPPPPPLEAIPTGDPKFESPSPTEQASRLWARADESEVAFADSTVTAALPEKRSAGPVAPASMAAGSLPLATASADSITMSRGRFFAGLAAIGLVVAVLGVLALASRDSSVQVADESPSTTTDEAEGGDPAETDTPADDGADAVLRDEIDGLSAEVADLETRLAEQPIPALPGTAMRRIVVASDANFVSVGVNGVAVVGPFGGYAAIDPATNTVTATGQVAGGATRVMRTASAVWITNYADSEIVRVDAVANQVLSSFSFPGPDGIAKDGSSLIVASFDGAFVARVDSGSGEILQQVDVLGSPTAVAVSDNNGIWAAIFETGELVQIDPVSFTITSRVIVGAGPMGLALHEGSLWVTNSREGTIAEIDLATTEILQSIAVGAGPAELVVVGPHIWVTVTGDGNLLQIDRTTGEIVTRTPLGSSSQGGPNGISVGNGSIWVAVRGERSVVRITPPEE